MKWVGQHIYDLISRFRDDVYLEDLSTTTETNVLVVDSDGKVSKSTTLADDIIESEIDTLAGLTSFGAAGATTNILAGDLTMYNAVNDGNPTISLGSSATNDFEIQTVYNSGTQTLDYVNFKSTSASSTTNDGRFYFYVDGNDVMTLLDKAVFIKGKFNITQDSSGDATPAPALTVANEDIDQIALSINADNTTANVLDITADAVTTAAAINVSADALTSGSALAIEDNSSIDGISGNRNTVRIFQANDAADNATALRVQGKGGANCVVIDKDADQLNAAQDATALHIDFDRTTPTSGTAAHNDRGINLDVNSASLGTSSLYGMDIDVVGATSGTSTAYGIDVSVSGADSNYGVKVLSADRQLQLLYDASNYCNFTVSSSGDLEIATVGAGTTDSDLTLDIDGDITLDAAGENITARSDQFNFDSTNANDPLVLIKNTADDATSGRLRFLSARGADGQDDDEVGIIQFFGYDDGTPSGEEYATIKGTIHDATSGQESGRLQLQVASHDGGSEDGLVLTGGSVDAEVDVTIGNGAASVVTIPGNIDLAGDIDVDGTLETDALTIGGATVAAAGTSSITTLGTITTGVWNGTKITDIYTNSSGKRYGNTIKILPSDFMINDDAASPLSFKDGSNSGVHVNDAASEAVAFVTIPEGMKATHVDVYATHNRTLKVWEVDLNASFDFTSTTIGTGACNTQLDITDVNATATNYLAVQVALSATTQRIWGGIVTIAAQ